MRERSDTLPCGRGTYSCPEAFIPRTRQEVLARAGLQAVLINTIRRHSVEAADKFFNYDGCLRGRAHDGATWRVMTNHPS